MRTNYVGHDTVYKRLRSAGQTGWDKTGDAYRQRERQLSRILDAGRAPATGRLLELGCGAGNISLWLAARGYQVTGVDIAPTAIDWAREKAREAGADVRFLLGSVLDLATFSANAFDFVLDGHCLHCIIGEDCAVFLSEAFRVLKPGGYFLVDTMCGPVKPGTLEGYDEASRCSLFKGIASRYWGPPEEITADVAAAGFKVLNTEMQQEASHGNITVEAAKPEGAE